MVRNAVMPVADNRSNSLSDDELLRQYVTLRDDTAFETLVRRHGPMVRRVCLRILSNTADVDDAFQATFIVLARKAASPRRVELAGWLYGVAQHVARDCASPGQEASGSGDAGRHKPARTDLSAEPCRVPDRLTGGFRSGIGTLAKQVSDAGGAVLPGRENQRRSGAAAGLFARQDCRHAGAGPRPAAGRLARRGVTVSGAALAAWLTQETANAASVAVGVQSAAKAATLAAVGKGTTVTGPATALAGSTLKAMTWAKVKLWAVLSMTAAAVAVPAVILLVPEQREIWQHRLTVDLQPLINFHAANPKYGTIRGLEVSADGNSLVLWRATD